MNYQSNTIKAFSGMAEIIRPPVKRDAAGWANDERILPPGSPEPGRWRSSRTPFMIPVMQAAGDPRYSTVVMACGSQMGKTEGILNVIGHRFTDGPYVPALLIFPTEKLARSMSKDRFSKMVESTRILKDRLEKGQSNKLMEKFFNGIRCGFGYAGSATELSSHPAGLVVIDEIDRMSDVSGEGDPYLLAKARTKNYVEAVVIITSTPTVEGASRIWSLWESGTMGRWSWKCKHCEEYFVPELSLLKYDKKGSPAKARKEACVVCPGCGSELHTRDREKMNQTGRYEYCMSDGENGYVNIGTDPPVNPTASFWASGLASPWQTFGDIAYIISTAFKSKDVGTIQGAVNTYGGETYKLRGDAPDWKRVKTQITDYSESELPGEIQMITMGVDVQEKLLYYVIRGYGYRGESWLIRHGEIHGLTEFDLVWMDLKEVVSTPFGGMPISRVFVDSGYVPGKKHFVRPDNKIYLFCRAMRGLCFPSKGKDMQAKPIISSGIDLTISGKVIKNGLTLWHIDTDYFKRQLYNAIRADPIDKYGWHIPKQISEDYCRQITSEECLTADSGKRTWITIRDDNHFLDCEVLADAAAYSGGVHNLKDITPPAVIIPEKVQQDTFIPQYGNSFIRR